MNSWKEWMKWIALAIFCCLVFSLGNAEAFNRRRHNSRAISNLNTWFTDPDASAGAADASDTGLSDASDTGLADASDTGFADATSDTGFGPDEEVCYSFTDLAGELDGVVVNTTDTEVVLFLFDYNDAALNCAGSGLGGPTAPFDSFPRQITFGHVPDDGEYEVAHVTGCYPDNDVYFVITRPEPTYEYYYRSHSVTDPRDSVLCISGGTADASVSSNGGGIGAASIGNQ